MEFTQYEDYQVQKLSHDEAYRRIKMYYSDFIKKWNILSPSAKRTYIFGNGRLGSVEYVDKSSTFLASLKSNPSLADSIDLAKNVIFQSRNDMKFVKRNFDHGTSNHFEHFEME